MTSAFTQVVQLQDVARAVVKNLSTSESSPLTPNQVHSVYKCMGKFISFMFKKTQNYEWVLADIQSFGTVLRNNNVSYFVPSTGLSLETHISKTLPSKITENSCKQELLLSKISMVT